MSKKKEKKPRGFRVLVDWSQIEELAMAGCNGTEIAAHFGITPHQLYVRCADDRNQAWSYFSKIYYEKGNSLLKVQQFKQALEGDRVMLLWLGKQRLGQKETPEQKKEIPDEIKEFVDLLKASGPGQITIDSKTHELVIDENYKKEVKNETTE
jgi:hypothetical protein